jgi:spermidine/putrescine transport system substrate-binding protein
MLSKDRGRPHGTGRGPRRTAWRWRMLLAVTGLVAALVLAACGGDTIEGDPTEEVDAPQVPAGEITDQLTIANWPLYIDPGPEGTVARFEEEFDVDVNYREVVNDNDQFFGRVQEPLSRGDSGGFDMYVVTDWMAARMWNLGYLQRLNKDELPNVEENMVEPLRSPEFDPEREFSAPWQSGMTGLVVRTDLAPDVTSISDVFDPQYAGQVTMLTEMRDTVPLVMLEMGLDPETGDTEDFLAAIDRIQEAVDDGQIRRFTGNEYARDLIRGDAAISFGWSGDAIQLQEDNPNIEFILPEEGCNLWSDNMVIPVGAENPQTAQAFMDFVYRPDEQADIVEYVNFVSPVQGTGEVLRERDPDIADNLLIFPTDEYTEDCVTVRTIEGEEEREINRAFQQLLAG